jgi:hypothetical protein
MLAEHPATPGAVPDIDIVKPSQLHNLRILEMGVDHSFGGRCSLMKVNKTFWQNSQVLIAGADAASWYTSGS